MADYDESTYGEHIADEYDQWYDSYEEDAVTMLAEFAQNGRTLELGIGTGRIALPLAERGVEVQGIDASSAMISKLRAKPGGGDLKIVVGNFADAAIEGEFSLIYVVFNTFFGLLTQEDQIRCFQNVAAHLTGNGVFLMEAFVPDMSRFSDGQSIRTSRITADGFVLDAVIHDSIEQKVTGQHVIAGKNGVKIYPIQIRYAWPSELDLMARLAGVAVA